MRRPCSCWKSLIWLVMIHCTRSCPALPCPALPCSFMDGGSWMVDHGWFALPAASVCQSSSPKPALVLSPPAQPKKAAATLPAARRPFFSSLSLSLSLSLAPSPAFPPIIPHFSCPPTLSPSFRLISKSDPILRDHFSLPPITTLSLSPLSPSTTNHCRHQHPSNHHRPPRWKGPF